MSARRHRTQRWYCRAQVASAPHVSRGTWHPVAVGIAGGFASGLLGVGGGTVIVPLLVFWLHLEQRTAHAASLAAIVTIGIVGATFFLAEGEVDLPLAAVLAAGGVVGSLVGVRLLDRISERGLRAVFAAFAFLAGARMLFT